jgi:hypothetical protein
MNNIVRRFSLSGIAKAGSELLNVHPSVQITAIAAPAFVILGCCGMALYAVTQGHSINLQLEMPSGGLKLEGVSSIPSGGTVDLCVLPQCEFQEEEAIEQ